MKSPNRQSVNAALTSSSTHSPSGPVVYGQTDHPTLDAIDRLAEQMLMPRSWVVTQILREWAEGRMAELRELEQSWNGSYREQLARVGVDA
jgi:hypothetical protein